MENIGEHSRAFQPQRLSPALSGPRRDLPAEDGEKGDTRPACAAPGAIIEPRLAVAFRRYALPALRPFG